MIQLKGAIDWGLTRLRLDMGDVITDHAPPDKDNGSMHFNTCYNGFI